MWKFGFLFGLFKAYKNKNNTSNSLFLDCNFTRLKKYMSDFLQ